MEDLQETEDEDAAARAEFQRTYRMNFDSWVSSQEIFGLRYGPPEDRRTLLRRLVGLPVAG